MKIVLADNAGFCFGVKRAINTAEAAGKKEKGRVFTYGPLIHNPQVVKKFENQGIKSVENINDLKKADSIIIRTHGVSPQRQQEFDKKDLRVIDATCPFVKKAQKYASELKQQGYSIVIIGEAEHPEVKGIRGYAGNDAAVVRDIKDAVKLPRMNKVGVVVQTTQSLENFRNILPVIAEKAREVKIYNTICDATKKRQDSALKLSKKVDIIIVIGGKKSANTKHLAEVCEAAGVLTYHIEEAGELKKSWFSGKKTAGITAGASTPDWVIGEVIAKLKKI